MTPRSIGPMQLRVLLFLAERPDSTMTEMAEEFDCHLEQVCLVLTRLCARKMARREVRRSPKRISFFLTHEGREELHRWAVWFKKLPNYLARVAAE